MGGAGVGSVGTGGECGCVCWYGCGQHERDGMGMTMGRLSMGREGMDSGGCRHDGPRAPTLLASSISIRALTLLRHRCHLLSASGATRPLT